MNRSRAIDILRTYWGTPNVVPASVVREIEAVEAVGESLFGTVLRVASGGRVNPSVRPFDHAHVRYLANLFECEERRT